MDRQVRRDLRLVDVEVAGDVTVLLTELGLGGVDAHLAVYESCYRPAEGVEGDPVAMGPLSGSGRRLEKRKNLSVFPPSRVLILHVPDCPLVERLRAEVESALAEVAAPDVRLSSSRGTTRRRHCSSTAWTSRPAQPYRATRVADLTYPPQSRSAMRWRG